MLGKISPWFWTMKMFYFSQLQYLRKYVCMSCSNCFLGVLFFPVGAKQGCQCYRALKNQDKLVYLQL